MIRNPLLLQADQLTWQAGKQPIIRTLSMQLEAGELLGVIGPNGAGKSSLLRMLANVQEPDTGTRKLQGQQYEAIEAPEFARRLSYLEQNPAIHWPVRVRSVIELGRLPHQGYFRTLSENDDAAIRSAIDATGVGRLLEQDATTLSAGEKLLVSLARVLATEPEIILADEPVAALDPYHQLAVMDTLTTLIGSGAVRAGIVVLHDLSLAARYCSRLLLMNHGSIVAKGEPQQVLTPANLAAHYRVDASVRIAGDESSIIPLHRKET